MGEREGEDEDEEPDENEQRPDLGIRHYRAAKRPFICGCRVDRMLSVCQCAWRREERVNTCEDEDGRTMRACRREQLTKVTRNWRRKKGMSESGRQYVTRRASAACDKTMGY